MNEVAKALCLFFAGLVLLITVGDRLFKENRRAESASVSETHPWHDTTPGEETFAERPDPPAPTTESSRSCDAYDPVARPEQILDILELASAQSCRNIQRVEVCTPVEILYAIWRVETGHVDGDGYGSGRCDVMSELAVRDAHADTRHAQAMLSMGKRFGWTERYGDRLERMTCSCPNRNKETGARKKGSYGGCCGPFQFSSAEVEKMAISLNLDPMRFCGGAVIAAKDLLRRYELAVNGGYRDRVKYARGYPAWRKAISSYYGYDPGSVYYSRALAKWQAFDGWLACGHRADADSRAGWFRKGGPDAGERCDQASLDRQWAFVRSEIVRQSAHSVRYFRALRDKTGAVASD